MFPVIERVLLIIIVNMGGISTTNYVNGCLRVEGRLIIEIFSWHITNQLSLYVSHGTYAICGLQVIQMLIF